MTFEEFYNQVSDLFERVSSCESCDPEFIADPEYSEISFSKIIYDAFCAKYATYEFYPDTRLDDLMLHRFYDYYLEETLAEIHRFNALLDHFHVK